ncbi:DUF5320 domain-containing protein [Desulfofundulus thermosubterraneus]|uniref:DUF5320 domain-containing protein n=1 Tax=Desulfofundulus thermosubterraneus DSM 16057 TaxID=1121432 RepID=A0A1M6JQJ9_9FIRM|nr:DUF5320 domain-containing protein [Desulfofundulus thermosubterraneus]SHJ48916.1 hypothetical protein SAMN02745219_02668 [Desulfofundulus thermosubterraneus DSM 16057]
MLRGDGTGPWGMGPVTGRGMGYCAGYNLPGFANAPGWCRPRRGAGWGAGRRGRFWWGGLPPAVATPSVSENEASVLKAQISHLEKILQGFKQRLEQVQGRSQGQTEQE